MDKIQNLKNRVIQEQLIQRNRVNQGDFTLKNRVNSGDFHKKQGESGCG